MEEERTKRCGVCKLDKPLSAFYAKPGVKDGRMSKCKDCQRQYVQGRYNRIRPVWPEGHKYCPRCKRVLLFAEFDKNARRGDGLQTYCKTCWPEYQKYWRKRPEAGFMATEKIKRSLKTPVGALKARARQLTALAIQFGHLVPAPCEADGCGSLDVQAHHTQYEKPLDGIRWYCEKHHLDVGHGGQWTNPPVGA